MRLKLFFFALAAFTSSAAAAQTPPPPVIDMHMHTPPAAQRAEWSAAMDELNVRAAILIGTPRMWPGQQGDNRLIPSLTFPCEGGRMPNSGAQCFDEGSEYPDVATLRRWIGEGRVRALGELNAQYAGVAPDDPRLEPYYALAEELDIPVGIHIGIGAPGLAYQGRPGFPPHKSPNYRAAAGDVTALESVLIRHPRLRVYVMHAAWPWNDAMLYMLYMHPQLHADVSVLQWAIPRPAYLSYLRRLVDAGFANRIMFGSDGGIRHLRAGIEAIMTADFLTEEQKRAILHDNAARFLRLDPPA
jgi:hypothetical protein